ncbi:hypothetical protein HOLleu_12538 [Holothuria leucospilota]|uniref:Uncharacterized protein n=1 Tax=Holothuria leucospilota TaxID=206669 RepID=A0A9Q1HD47_HOLLE|nr:hypothetical protein HOLleu_12538 [Holothuria leucospilota]
MILSIFGRSKVIWGHQRSKGQKTCKHDISRRVTVRDHILTLCIDHIEKMIPIIF